MRKSPFVILNNGNKVPLLGLGTYPMQGEECRNAVKIAYKAGIRLFDTSPAYGNENAIGEALVDKFSGFFHTVNRKKCLLTSKLSLKACIDHQEESELQGSLKRLRVSYLDLYLLHWVHPDHYIENYKAMERILEKGLVKTIGVCNCTVNHLENIIKHCTIVPAVNQVELHPLFIDEELIEFCQSHAIQIQSYTPFARMDKRIIENDVLQSLAKKYKKSIPQIILRWNIQRNFIVIPKSSSREHIFDFVQLDDFKLLDSEIQEINNINIHERVRYHPDEYYKIVCERERERERGEIRNYFFILLSKGYSYAKHYNSLRHNACQCFLESVFDKNIVFVLKKSVLLYHNR